MRAGVGDAVFRESVRAMVIVAVEGELKDSHSGEVVLVAQRDGVGGLFAEVFGDEGDFAELAVHGGEEAVTGHGNPFSAGGIFRAGGHGPDAAESEEMVHADGVELLESALEASDPPGETLVDVHRPAIVGVAPQLPEPRKRIGRIARDGGRRPVGVEHKEISPGPNVGRIVRDEDGNVADQPDAATIAKIFQGRPLPLEKPLDEFVKCDFIGESSPGIGQRRRIA